MTPSHSPVDRPETGPGVPHPRCRGICPGARPSAVILGEGACSHLASHLIGERRREARQGARQRRLLSGLILFPFLLGAGCRDQQPTGAAPAATAGTPSGGSAVGQPARAPEKKAPVQPPAEAKPYALTVEAPPEGKVGGTAAASIRVTPRGEYKVNLEFPHRLMVTGPEAAAPRSVQLAAKQATKLTKNELLLRPTFKLGAAGEHPFEGTLRFSVCTEKLCEIKSETVRWTAVVR